MAGKFPTGKADIAAQMGFKATREICQKHARSFYFASFFLRKDRRDAAYAVYAFCRLMDDAIDQVEDLQLPVNADGQPDKVWLGQELNRRLRELLLQLDQAYAQQLDLPAVNARTVGQHALYAFSLTVHRFGIPKEYFIELAKGCEMDLLQTRYNTWPDLELYCYRVAGVVGLIMSCVFGLSNPEAKTQAIMMGNAMQLTNILRDVREDYERGRIYLPGQELDRFGYSETELASGVVNESFVELMQFQIRRARDYYRKAGQGLCFLEDKTGRLTAAAMAVIYSGILSAIEANGYDVFRNRAHLTMGQKFRRLPAAFRLARRKNGEALPMVFGYR